MKDLYSILVIYNESVLNSPTYLFCQQHKDIHVIVCDNSTFEQYNKEVVEKDGFTYISMNGNKGLSKAYNKALDEIPKSGFVVLLDDDTQLNEEYYQILASLDETVDIYLPIVETQNGMISPAIIQKDIVSKSDGIDISYEEITGINSGMIINLDCFKEYRFDERLFLDYVDHFFIRDMKKRNKRIQVLPVKIQQNFSAESTNKETSRKRFSIFKQDSQIFYQNKKTCSYVINKRRLRLMINHKDVRFLWW